MRVSESKAKWVKRNRMAIRMRDQLLNLAFPELRRAAGKRYRKKNYARVMEIDQRWRDRNQEKVKEINRKSAMRTKYGDVELAYLIKKICTESTQQRREK